MKIIAKGLLILSTVILLGCDKVVEETSEKLGRETVTQSCTYHDIGYCFYMGKWQMSPFCTYHGNETVVVDKYLVKRTYESGEKSQYISDKHVRTLEECK